MTAHKKSLPFARPISLLEDSNDAWNCFRLQLGVSERRANVAKDQGWGLIDLPLRASNEGSPRPRVARAQKIISLHPLRVLRAKGMT
jgi:hypothetical protein